MLLLSLKYDFNEWIHLLSYKFSILLVKFFLYLKGQSSLANTLEKSS
jgi:hypothetical protein